MFDAFEHLDGVDMGNALEAEISGAAGKGIAHHIALFQIVFSVAVQIRLAAGAGFLPVGAVIAGPSGIKAIGLQHHGRNSHLKQKTDNMR